MKKLSNYLFCLLLSFPLIGQIPDLQVQDANGDFFNLPDLMEDDRNYGLIFWSAQDVPSVEALKDYHNYYSDWANDFNIEFLIIHIDPGVSQPDVVDFANQEGWGYTLLFASPADVYIALGVNQIPYIYLANQQQDIVFELAGWMQGFLFEDELAQLFPVGINEQSALKNIGVFSSGNNILVDTETVWPLLTVSTCSVDGKLLFQKTYKNQPINGMQINAAPLPTGTIVFVKIENEEGEFVTKKVIVK
ncbi:MAG: hypothetical protein AAFZ15_07280 [Bacteroidota bacterium]